IAQIKLPKLARKAKRGPPLIQIHECLDAKCSPEISERDKGANWVQFHLGVEGKELALFNEAVERVAVQMISMSRVSGKVGIRVMRRDDRDAAAGLRDPIEFGHEREDIRHMVVQ